MRAAVVVTGWARSTMLLQGDTRSVWFRQQDVWDCVPNEWGKREKWQHRVFETLGTLPLR